MKLIFKSIFVSSLLALSMVSCEDRDPVESNQEQIDNDDYENTDVNQPADSDDDEPDVTDIQIPIWPVDGGEIVDGIIPDVSSLPESHGEKNQRYWTLARPIKTEYIDLESIKVTFETESFNLSLVDGNIIPGNVRVPDFFPASNIQSVVMTKVDSEDYESGLLGYSVYLKDIPRQYKGKMYVKGKGETNHFYYEAYGEINGSYHSMYWYLKITEFKNGDGGYDGDWDNKEFKWNSSANMAEETPLYFEWETTTIPDEMRGFLTPSDLVQLIFGSPFIPANSFGLAYDDTRLISFNEFFKIISPRIKFNKNSYWIRIRNTYTHLGTVSSYEEWSDIFPAYTITYIPRGNGKLSLFINPGGIMDINVLLGSGAGGGPNYYYPMNTTNLYGLLANALLALSPGIAEGLPAEIHFNGDSMSLYLTDSDNCANLLKKVVLPLLRDEVYKARLLRSIEDNPETVAIYEAVRSGLDSFEMMLEATKTMKIGVNTDKYQVSLTDRE